VSDWRCHRLATATPFHHHAGQHAVDDVEVGVVVQHGYGGHLAGRAARSRAKLGHLHQVGVWVLREQHRVAHARTVVGHVTLGRDNPVPAKLLEVDRQRKLAAPGLRGRLVARQSGRSVSPGPGPPVLPSVHLQVRDLTILYGPIGLEYDWIRMGTIVFGVHGVNVCLLGCARQAVEVYDIIGVIYYVWCCSCCRCLWYRWWCGWRWWMMCYNSGYRLHNDGASKETVSDTVAHNRWSMGGGGVAGM